MLNDEPVYRILDILQCLLLPILLWNVFLDNPKPEACRFDTSSKRTVGRIYSKEMKTTTCTATLVSSSPAIIMTAAHCFVDDKTGVLKHDQYGYIPAWSQDMQNKMIALRFTDFYICLPHASRAYVPPQDARDRDIAFVKLSKQPSGINETTELCAIADVKKWTNSVSTLMGYPSGGAFDDRCVEENYCTRNLTYNDGDGTFLHRCDTTPRMSGSPMFITNASGKTCVLAMHVAGKVGPDGAVDGAVRFSDEVANVAVGSENIARYLEKAKEAYQHTR